MPPDYWKNMIMELSYSIEKYYVSGTAVVFLLSCGISGQ